MSLTEPIILEPVPLLSGFRKKSVVPRRPTWSCIGRIATRLPVIFQRVGERDTPALNSTSRHYSGWTPARQGGPRPLLP